MIRGMPCTIIELRVISINNKHEKLLAFSQTQRLAAFHKTLTA